MRPLSSIVLLAHAACLTLCFAACSSPDLSGPTGQDLAHLPWSLRLSAHAITMDTLPPYNDLQLSAVARTVDGTPLPGSAVIMYTSSDSSVRVDSTGRLTARRQVSGVMIRASVVYRGVRIEDSALVNVTASTTTPPSFRELQLQLPATDSTKMAAPNKWSVFYVSDTKQLIFGALDDNGSQIANSLVDLLI
jgi:hypothetical protein